MNIFRSDLSSALSGLPLDKEKISAFDYSLYYNDWKNSDDYHESERYFEKLISGTVPFTYPAFSKGKASQGNC